MIWGARLLIRIYDVVRLNMKLAHLNSTRHVEQKGARLDVLRSSSFAYTSLSTCIYSSIFALKSLMQDYEPTSRHSAYIGWMILNFSLSLSCRPNSLALGLQQQTETKKKSPRISFSHIFWRNTQLSSHIYTHDELSCGWRGERALKTKEKLSSS